MAGNVNLSAPGAMEDLADDLTLLGMLAVCAMLRQRRLGRFGAEQAHRPVIGNGISTPPRCPIPPTMRAVAKTLGELGFEVVLGTTSTAAAWKAGCGFLDSELRAGGALFYAPRPAGGCRTICTGGREARNVERSHWHRRPRPHSREPEDRHANIVILDACRDNPLAQLARRRARRGRRGLRPIPLGTGTLIAFSTAPQGGGGRGRQQPSLKA
jgi:hypothetical protein